MYKRRLGYSKSEFQGNWSPNTGLSDQRDLSREWKSSLSQGKNASVGWQLREKTKRDALSTLSREISNKHVHELSLAQTVSPDCWALPNLVRRMRTIDLKQSQSKNETLLRNVKSAPPSSRLSWKVPSGQPILQPNEVEGGTGHICLGQWQKERNKSRERNAHIFCVKEHTHINTRERMRWGSLSQRGLFHTFSSFPDNMVSRISRESIVNFLSFLVTHILIVSRASLAKRFFVKSVS